MEGIFPKLRFIPLFFLGFSTGLPFLLILSTLSIWLVETGINKTQIGLFAYATIPYSLKILWGPIIEKVRLPVLTRLLGKRRGWLLLAQLMLMLSLIVLGRCRPEQNIYAVAVCAFMVGLFGAVQDIVINTYRIERLSSSDLGLGNSFFVSGDKLGMLCGGAGAVYLSHIFSSWYITYTAMGLMMLVGVCTTLLIKEPSYSKEPILKPTIISSIKTFFLTHQWRIILPFIIFQKMPHIFVSRMSMPFLLEIGFNKLQIAQAATTFGMITGLMGSMLGGIALCRSSLSTVLLWNLILEVLSTGLFLVQAIVGTNIYLLFVTMGVRYFTSGLGNVAIMTYLSRQCLPPHTAIHLAILSSFGSLVRINFSMLSGWMADCLTWPWFYGLIMLGCIPAIIMVSRNMRHFSVSSN